MSEASDVVLRMIKAITAGDLAGALACLDRDVEVVEPGSLPFGGVHRGVDAFRDDVLVAITRKMEPQVERFELLEQGEKVAVLMVTKFTSRTTRQTLVMPYIELYTVADGKIRKIDVYPQDTQKLVAFWNEN